MAEEIKEKKIISVVGAGGKTTYIHRLADRYRREGLKVFVTTTTHMYCEADTDTSCCASSIIDILQKEGYCMAGRLSHRDPAKITSLPDEVLTNVMKIADMVLIEADGAKGYPSKFPNDTEPVIHPATTDIVLIMGRKAIGLSWEDGLFRYQLMKDQMAMIGEGPITEELLKRIMKEIYLPRLARMAPGIPVSCLWAIDNGYESVSL